MISAHRIVIFFLVILVFGTLLFLAYQGQSFYRTPVEERFFHPGYAVLKPSGVMGHGLGIAGSFFMLMGVGVYLWRKYSRRLGRLGKLSRWLEFHIFLCTLGPMLILFHTTFKFDGLVAISFWSMVAVFVSGIIGRFIYIQIPRTIEGRELSLSEIRDIKASFSEELRKIGHLSPENLQLVMNTAEKNTTPKIGNPVFQVFRNWASDRQTTREIKQILKKDEVLRKEIRLIVKLVKNDLSLNRRIERLQTMQKVFRYWHVAHMPFAIVMLVIMVIHVAVTMLFGYRWIF